MVGDVQTQLPPLQIMPSGQQKPLPVESKQAWFCGQHRPPAQTEPVGQQTLWPLGPTQGAAPLAQTHLPSRQTVPSGQQNWLGAVGDPQILSLGQH